MVEVSCSKENNFIYAIFKYFWVIVVLPKYFQLIVIALIFIGIKQYNSKIIRKDSFFILQLTNIAIFFVAIVYSLVRSHDIDRVFAAMNTLSIAVVALLLYEAYRYSNVCLDYVKLGKYCFWDLIVLIVWWMYFTLVSPIGPIVLFGHSLSGIDWVNGLMEYRFFGYLDYANMVIFLILFLYPLSLYYLKEKMTKLSILIYSIVLFLVVISTNSRSGLLIIFALICISIVLILGKDIYTFVERNKLACVFMLLLACLCVGILFYEKIVDVVSGIFMMREGSNGMRTRIYTQSMETMIAQSPIIGMGIKDMVFGYPLGSHSTFIGMFYKTGFIGGTIYIVSLLYIIIKIFKIRNDKEVTLISKISLLFILALMIVEDIDGTNWGICIFFILIAMLGREQREDLYR